jgi:hypothetical protein
VHTHVIWKIRGDPFYSQVLELEFQPPVDMSRVKKGFAAHFGSNMAAYTMLWRKVTFMVMAAYIVLWGKVIVRLRYYIKL